MTKFFFSSLEFRKWVLHLLPCLSWQRAKFKAEPFSTGCFFSAINTKYAVGVMRAVGAGFGWYFPGENSPSCQVTEERQQWFISVIMQQEHKSNCVLCRSEWGMLASLFADFTKKSGNEKHDRKNPILILLKLFPWQRQAMNRLLSNTCCLAGIAGHCLCMRRFNFSDEIVRLLFTQALQLKTGSVSRRRSLEILRHAVSAWVPDSLCSCRYFMYLRDRASWQITWFTQDFSCSPVPFNVCNSASETCSPVSLGFACSVNTSFENWQESSPIESPVCWRHNFV